MKIGTRVREYSEYVDNEPVWASPVIGTVIGVKLDGDGYAREYEVRWDDGRISTSDCLDDVTPKLFVNIYLHDRCYGGGEEGGWWYDDYSPEQEECRVFDSEEAALAYLPTAEAWCAEENSQRRSDISSVISEGRYEAILESFPAEYSPSERPRYC